MIDCIYCREGNLAIPSRNHGKTNHVMHHLQSIKFGRNVATKYQNKSGSYSYKTEWFKFITMDQAEKHAKTIKDYDTEISRRFGQFIIILKERTTK